MEDIKSSRFGFWDLMGWSWLVWRGNLTNLLAASFVLHIPLFFFNMLAAKLFPGASFVVCLFVNSLGGFFLMMTVARIVDSSFKNEKMSWISAWKHSVSHSRALLLTVGLAALIVLGMLVLLIVPGVLWAGYYLFVIQVVALRGLHGKAALDYSKAVVKGEWFLVFCTICMIDVAVSIAKNIAFIPLGLLFLYNATCCNVLSWILEAAASSIIYCGYAIFFLNCEHVRNLPGIKHEELASALDPDVKAS